MSQVNTEDIPGPSSAPMPMPMSVPSHQGEVSREHDPKPISGKWKKKKWTFNCSLFIEECMLITTCKAPKQINNY